MKKYDSFIPVIIFIQVKNIVKKGDGLMIVETDTGTISDVDCVLWAIGRTPNTDSLDLHNVVSS